MQRIIDVKTSPDLTMSLQVWRYALEGLKDSGLKCNSDVMWSSQMIKNSKNGFNYSLINLLMDDAASGAQKYAPQEMISPRLSWVSLWKVTHSQTDNVTEKPWKLFDFDLCLGVQRSREPLYAQKTFGGWGSPQTLSGAHVEGEGRGGERRGEGKEGRKGQGREGV